MNTTIVFSQRWIEIVFDGRNKAYGAYELRRINDRTLLAAVIFTTAAAAGVAMYSFFSGFNSHPPDVTVFIPLTLDNLQPPPIIEARKQPAGKQPEIKKPKARAEYRFDIVDSNEVTEQVDTNEAMVQAVADTGIAGGGMASASVNMGNSETGSGDAGGNEPENNNPIDWTDEMPEFPGGYSEFVKFISKNAEYLEIARENGIEGTVYVSFVVETDGSITQAKVVRGIFKPLDEEAVRVVKMMPNWKPGKQKGKPVRVRFKVPIKFAFR